MSKETNIEVFNRDAFATRLKKLRSKNGYTQSELAEKLNMDDRTYGNYEQGRTTPPLDCIVSLCSIYGISADYLLREENVCAAEHITKLLEKCPTKKWRYIENIVKNLVEAFEA